MGHIAAKAVLFGAVAMVAAHIGTATPAQAASPGQQLRVTAAPRPDWKLGVYGWFNFQGLHITDLAADTALSSLRTQLYGGGTRVRLERGDVIASVDGRPIPDLFELKRALNEAVDLYNVRLRVIDVRNGNWLTLYASAIPAY